MKTGVEVALIGAVAAAAVAVVGGIQGSISAYYQNKSDVLKERLTVAKDEVDKLFPAQSEDQLRNERLRTLIRFGLISDPNGDLCTFYKLDTISSAESQNSNLVQILTMQKCPIPVLVSN
jgi:hypothetical protein